MNPKWYGWGQKDHSYPFKNKAQFEKFLKKQFGKLDLCPPRPFDPASISPTRLSPTAQKQLESIFGSENLSIEPLDRAVHSLGKSYKDLVRLRNGIFNYVTDVVVYPSSEEQILKLMDFARTSGATLIPFGGGTTVVGGVEPGPDSSLVITVDLRRLNRLVSLDPVSQTATFEGGILGPDLENILNKEGFTLGHFPQSFEYSTLGGWIATRSAGHKSTAYGKIEHLVQAVRVALSDGQILETAPFPGHATGPDLLQLICGSEGRYGIILQATVKIRPLPDQEIYKSYLFKSFSEGLEAVRSLLQMDISPPTIRLSDEDETETLFTIDALSSSKLKHTFFKVGLGALGPLGHSICPGALLILGFEGQEARLKSDLRQSFGIIKKFGGFPLGSTPGLSWLKSRYEQPYLRDELLDRGILVDTLETVSVWSKLPDLHRAVKQAIQETVQKQNRPGLVGTHLSHAYRDGASLYYTFMVPQIRGHEIEQWQEIKAAATNAMVRAGGAVSHHHGVGRDHVPWLEASLGKTGYRIIQRIGNLLSSEATINPGILYPEHSKAHPERGSFSLVTRNQNLQRFSQETFDLVIIGGGITGTGIARDAAMRGMKVALLEKRDFAFGTSGRSSKLIHGGLRYLKHLDIKLVRESLREREVLLKLAPHLVHPAPFLLPVYKGAQDKKFEIKIGLIGYDFLAGSKALGRHEMLSKQEILQLEPILKQEKLKGGFIYYDCVVDDARLTLATLKSAAQAGAVVANYAEVTSFEFQNGQIVAAQFQDRIKNTSGIISGKVFVNATGPWTDHIRKLQGETTPLLRPTKGIHIVVPHNKLPVQHIIVVNTPDGRLIFVVPYGDYVYIGTTDTDYEGDYDQVVADQEDIEYLIQATNREFEAARLDFSDVISTWAGLRPLIKEEGAPSDVSRDYEIMTSDHGLVTISGGKLTTYRHMAEVLVDWILDEFADRLEGKFLPCRTREVPLHGGEMKDYSSYLESVQKGLGERWKLNSKTVERLIKFYGTDYLKILSYGIEEPALLKPLAPGVDILKAEVLQAIEEEMTLTLGDFMTNRTHLLTFDWDNGREAVPVVAGMMRQALGWSPEEYQRQVDSYHRLVMSFRR